MPPTTVSLEECVARTCIGCRLWVSLQVARQAKQQRTGARGLRAILERIMLEAMFVVPNENDDAARCSAHRDDDDDDDNNEADDDDSDDDAAARQARGHVTGVFVDSAAVRGVRPPLLTRHPASLGDLLAALAGSEPGQSSPAGCGGGGWELQGLRQAGVAVEAVALDRTGEFIAARSFPGEEGNWGVDFAT